MKVNLTAVTSRAAAALVAAVAGFASYQHIYDVATGAGEHVTVAAVLPLAIDGLILVATVAMLDDKRQKRHPRPSARVALLFGVVATLAANVASAEPTATARMVAAIPAVSFLLAVEVLARTGKPLAPVATPTVPAVVSPTLTPATPPPADTLTAIVDATTPATVATPQPANDTPPRPVKRSPQRAAKTRQSNAERVATAVARKPELTQADVAKLLQLGERTVQRYWPKPPATVNGHHHAQEVAQ